MFRMTAAELQPFCGQLMHNCSAYLTPPEPERGPVGQRAFFTATGLRF